VIASRIQAVANVLFPDPESPVTLLAKMAYAEWRRPFFVYTASFRNYELSCESSRLCGVGRSGSSEGSTASDNYFFTGGGLSPPVLSGSILLKKDCDSEYRQMSSRTSP
jgi:hypothetical protein